MDDQILQYGEAKVLEPLYRMYKVIASFDMEKAQTLLAVATQYIINHYRGAVLRPADVQQILRAVLLQEADGQYYARYVYNEIQVKAAEWLTILAADLTVTLEKLGEMMNQLAEGLQERDYIKLAATDVLQLLKQVIMPVDTVLLERFQLNEERYLTELRTFLVQ